MRNEANQSFPAVYFEPDGYVLDGPKLMGRQAAGNSFLRALIDAAEACNSKDNCLWAWSPAVKSAEVFDKIVRDQAPSVRTGWIPSDRGDLLKNVGALYLPGPGLGDAANWRLRQGVAAWSLTGVTHTLCSHTAMDSIIRLLEAPVMPWDALICTSTVAKHAVSTLLELQGQYLAWRFGVKSFSIPQLPVIPLGVHAGDFAYGTDKRKSARAKLNLSDNDVAVLFAGRLSFHAKAHPFPMLLALEEVAGTSSERIKLLLCGQFPNEAVRGAFIDGTRKYAPSIDVMWVDGKDFSAYANAWAASDIFVSLSDNLQETFGITPLEAMATGMPVLVSDWDGYKDTVVDGETGFRIPTWMPPPDLGSALASSFEAGSINYDRYIGLACLDVSLDQRVLVERLGLLVRDPGLRNRMGRAARQRVMAKYDWSVVIRQYMDLWRSLDECRLAALSSSSSLIRSAPSAAPARQDPYRVFSAFPTKMIGPQTLVSRSRADERGWGDLRLDPLFSYAADYLPTAAQVDHLIALLDTPQSLAALSERAGLSLAIIIKILAPLAKADFVRFEP